ncbi:hypothetical protein NEOLEDRAFT_1175458 [Neolentinus lepideus HHB14362 ss-1]|uniref:CUE domain-containing protein n=1 Tax=Neolentinus lepideus HHB14362 ss-1 TaxID=1314782 RepID=A0A165V4P9_9AGAM|nr:hypothetical protein NEOLEDRAFT_1175458 [Neolentinus lepideus HHB14362 ss-1]
MTATEPIEHSEAHSAGNELASNPFANTSELGPPGAAQSSPSTDVATLTTSDTPVHSESHIDDGPPLPPRTSEPDIHEEAVDPRVASLQPMFPDFEPIILQSVLESVGWDQGRAVDALLGMNDPDYVPQHQPEPPAPSQTDLDEQLARRLMLEEEQQAAARHQWAPSNRRSRPQGAPQGGWGGPGSPSQGGQRDTMAEFQDQFSKVAEVGKKTFSSIVSKVKAKMQEFDQSSQGQGSTSNTTPNWGGPSNPSYQYQGQSQTVPDRHAQQAYYAPNVYAEQGYDVTPNAAPQREVPLSTQAPTNVPTTAAGSPPTSSSPPAHSETPRPPSTQTGPPTSSIDPTKIGLLPKRPVSLIRDQQPSSQPHDDEEELDYVENPFEDRK